MVKLNINQKRWWEFLIVMVEREIRIKYKNTLLGFGWILINPLTQMLVFGFIFQYILKTKIENYFLFIFSGFSLWNFFSLSITGCTSIIINRRSFVRKTNFPKETIVLSIIVFNLISLLLSSILYFLFLVLNQNFFFINNWAEILLVIFWILILTSGFSLGLSALNIKHRDIGFMVNAIIPIWFYATPVVYEVQMLPAKFNKLLYLNPVTAIIEVFRYATIGTAPLNWNLCYWSFLGSVLILFLGITIFSKLNPWFDDWI